MASISSAPAEASVRRARKTVTFTGLAGAGAAGTVALFTTTGRVYIEKMTAYCTVNLTESGATSTISVGTASIVNCLLTAVNAVDLDADEFWVGNQAVLGSITTITGGVGNTASSMNKCISQNIIATIAVADVTAGALVFDVWYTPITDNGLLA